MQIKTQLHKSVSLLPLLILLIGCQDVPEPTPTTSAPPPTQTPDLTPKPTDISLEYPEKIALGEILYVDVINQENIPYVFFQPEGDNFWRRAQRHHPSCPFKRGVNLVQVDIIAQFTAAKRNGTMNTGPAIPISPKRTPKQILI